MAVHPAPYSDDFAATAREEVDRLTVRAAEVRTRAERWLARGEELMREAERLEVQVRDLDELLGRAPQLRIDLQKVELQGQQLREAAMKILMQREGTKRPIHYRKWYDLVTAHGIRAAGKNPLATFLTQITRSPIVERVEGETGVYQLNPQRAFERARDELGKAQRLLNSLRDAGDGGGANPNELQDAQKRFADARQRFETVLQARTALLRARLSA